MHMRHARACSPYQLATREQSDAHGVTRRARPRGAQPSAAMCAQNSRALPTTALLRTPPLIRCGLVPSFCHAQIHMGTVLAAAAILRAHLRSYLPRHLFAHRRHGERRGGGGGGGGVLSSFCTCLRFLPCGRFARSSASSRCSCTSSSAACLLRRVFSASSCATCTRLVIHSRTPPTTPAGAATTSSLISSTVDSTVSCASFAAVAAASFTLDGAAVTCSVSASTCSSTPRLAASTLAAALSCSLPGTASTSA
mmetsp:Transcript_67956/g.203196  ORF Transcript_67956/g.203196 Transcript_67956/m.203196 type:complete len:253 (+) Transcript_67956:186-944(+)